ncbi:zinc-ribbon domain-containing protein [Kordiimonas aquimaris]|uniref:zinc-ribbon domain-containing protein n=1 Tax=Kordiimonas aquimaris TaxID=707591 RepID=UPI0021D13037|nr:zinc-ribbon domain-containing protein [Kordiimonas aquimaris]
MILVCPTCESKFNVPDGAIPPEGRRVRCAQCKNSWHATKANELKPAAPKRTAVRPAMQQHEPPVVDAGAAAKAAAIRRAVVEEEVPPAPAVEDDLYDEGVAVNIPDDGDDVNIQDDFGEQDTSISEDYPEDIEDDDFESDYLEDDEDDILARRRGDLRRDAERKSSARKRKLLTAGWSLLLIFWLTVLLVPIFMKDTLTSAFPASTQLYEFFSGADYADRFRPEEGETLTPPITETEVYVTAKLHGDRTRVETVDGKQQLVIRGFVENTGNRAANVPLVEISVKDRRGTVIEQWNYAPQGLVLRRRSKLEFETMLYPIPSGANVVEVRSLEGTRSTNEAESKL